MLKHLTCMQHLAWYWLQKHWVGGAML